MDRSVGTTARDLGINGSLDGAVGRLVVESLKLLDSLCQKRIALDWRRSSSDRSGSGGATRIETKVVRVTDLLAIFVAAVNELLLAPKSVCAERDLLAVDALQTLARRSLLESELCALGLGGLSRGLLGCRNVRCQLADEKSHGLVVEVGAKRGVAELILREEILADVSEHDWLLELACGNERALGRSNLAAGSVVVEASVRDLLSSNVDNKGVALFNNVGREDCGAHV